MLFLSYFVEYSINWTIVFLERFFYSLYGFNILMSTSLKNTCKSIKFKSICVKAFMLY
jgi:hypothetical protein